jgi:shikimate dehydrogenase
MKLFAVAGNPILHSRSPRIFARLFRDTGVEGAYFRLLANDAKELSEMVRKMGLDGINVTSPFKTDLVRFLDGIEPSAAAIGAVNCVYRQEGRLIGANTDHVGVIRTIRAHGIDPRGRAAVVFGAGGAARAAIYALVKAGIGKVAIVNRSPERAAAMDFGPSVVVRAPEDSHEALRSCDICLSCIPCPIPLADPAILKDGCLVMSASYKEGVSQAREDGRGAIFIDGREWLFYQAGPGFELMTGHPVPDGFPDEEVQAIASSAQERKPNIALVGFSGAGKSETGRILAETMRYGFIDTDAEVEGRAGRPIPEIFRERGEGVFRRYEKDVIARSVPRARETVFAVGGGAVCDAETAALLRRHCEVVWLWASPETSMGRITAGSRPMLDGDSGARARTLLAGRIPIYAGVADLALSSDNGTADDSAKRIKNEMDRAFGN